MSAILPGYVIIHKKYGEGTVISDGVYVMADFPYVGTTKLDPSWVRKNCKIIVPEEMEEKISEEAERLKTVLEKIIEAKIRKVIAEFERFHLSDFGRKELENFFRFKLHYAAGHKRELRYHLLLQSENDSESNAFLKALERGLRQLGVLSKKAIIETESSVADSLPKDFPLKCSLLAVHDCEPIQKDSVHIVSSAVRAELQLTRRKKDLVWKSIKEISELCPDCTVVASGPKSFVDYLKENDDLFFRFFAHRIIIQPMSEADVMKAAAQSIRAEGLIITQPFQEALQKYISVIYPKADLKDMAFVDDLMNRVFVNYHLFPKNRLLTEKHVPFYRKPKSFEEISERLNQLVGLKKVKQQFRDLYRLSMDLKSVNQRRLHFAFVGNPGTGKTTVAQLTAELLFSMGLIKRNKLVSIASTDVISVYKGESGQLMKEKIDEAMGGVLFIDEAYFLTSKTSETNSPNKQCVDILIKMMEDHSDELTVIFAGYPEEIGNMLQSNPGIASRVPFTFVFEDYSDEELLEIFLNLAEKEEMTLDVNAYPMMMDRIALAKTEENFGNARTMANIYQQLKTIWLNSEREKRVILAEDVRKSMPVALNSDLDKMIGLTSVKRELKIFESRIKYMKFLSDKNITIPASNMHMMFTGNPGTGKTTVARKIADCLYQIGILKTNKLVVAERKDLVGQYVGETAIKTNQVIEKAMNGVLFVDEAYSLSRVERSADTGAEAIATLITAMENRKDRLVVIFAGYTKEMRDFRLSNPGITSRIGFTFDFPDYSPEELTEMFYCKMRDCGFSVSADALEDVRAVMEYFSKMDDFGNGRFVDKVIDQTINNRSNRTYSKQYNDIGREDVPTIKDLIGISAVEDQLWTDDEQSDELRWRIAVHEAGHSLVALFGESPKSIQCISINADAGSPGRTQLEHLSDSVTEKELRAILAVKFGGRNAERLLCGDHSAGCSADISEAKNLARHMIDDLAVGEFGVTTPMDLLQEADRNAAEILEAHRAELEQVVRTLLEHGVIYGPELQKLVGKRSDPCLKA